ncbi:hypothetical protein [Actinoplanes sp. NPDC051494]|uniref:hypothetical protein n=1 Tax=Actinoplanes sp. NPDC051494 TaxID=3363907 RepID=UPI0037B0B10C
MNSPTVADPIAMDCVLRTLHTTAPDLWDNHSRTGGRLPRLHLLLFFAQGHNLARFDRPLFTEPIVRTEHDVHVDLPAEFAGAEPSPGSPHLNLIAAVVARYGRVVFPDLKALVVGSQPWQSTAVGEPIRVDALRAWFTRDAETNDPDDERPRRAELARWAAQRKENVR